MWKEITSLKFQTGGLHRTSGPPVGGHQEEMIGTNNKKTCTQWKEVEAASRLIFSFVPSAVSAFNRGFECT